MSTTQSVTQCGYRLANSQYAEHQERSISGVMDLETRLLRLEKVYLFRRRWQLPPVETSSDGRYMSMLFAMAIFYIKLAESVDEVRL
jgi:hypothetical protein